MKPLVRWAKFNAVGALGMGVQLAVLAGFNRLFCGHYLAATVCRAGDHAAAQLPVASSASPGAIASHSTPGLRALWRFHVSNGLVSLCGNLLLMRLLVQGAHVPLLVANVAAILCCSVANFALGTRWAFAASRHSHSCTRLRP